MTRLKGGVIWAGVIAFHIIGFIPHAHAADLLEGPRVSGGGFGGGLKDGPADLPPLWAGFYVGGYAGGVWTGTNLSDGFTYEGDPSYKGTFDGTGFTGGGTLGYNIQRGHAVFGVEGDIGYLSLSGSKAVNYTQPAGCSHTYADTGYTAYPSDLCGVNANYSLSGGLYGDITGRAGYAFDNILLYAKGGEWGIEWTDPELWQHPEIGEDHGRFK